MAEIKYTDSEVAALLRVLDTLIQHCESFQTGASGFAGVLPGVWQGPASGQFQGLFAQWAGGAATLSQRARELKGIVLMAQNSYSGAGDRLGNNWAGTAAMLEG